MKKKIALILVGVCITAGVIVGCGRKNNVQAIETSNLKRVGTLDEGNRTITTYIDDENKKIIYVVQNKNNNAGISITAVDIK